MIIELNILVVMNAFKGTLTSLEANQTIKDYLRNSGHQVTSIPMSDGGDGFLDAISSIIKGEYIEIDTYNPLGKSIKTKYYRTRDIGYIELAKVSGLSLIKEDDRNPFKTSTYGLGVVIKHAIDQGIKHICLGIGGSATHDGGVGMLQAMGVKFYHNGKIIDENITGKMLVNITSFDTNVLDDLINHVNFEVVSDVRNPLLGMDGAAHVYASQKGASQEDILVLENNMSKFADVTEKHFNHQFRKIGGAGAAGGVAFGMISFLKARLQLGTDYMIKLLKIEDEIKKTDLVIVGEGKLDEQTKHGKAPFGIANLARKYEKHVIGIFALIDERVKTDFLDTCYAIVPKYLEMEEALINPSLGIKKVLIDIL